MSTALLFSHADTQPYTNTLPHRQQRRDQRRDTRKPTPPPRATVDDVEEFGPENPLIHAMTYRLDGALIGQLYDLCRRHNTGFDEIVTTALTNYVKTHA